MVSHAAPAHRHTASVRQHDARGWRRTSPARGTPFATSERLQVATCQDWHAARLPDRLDAVTKIQTIIAGPRHEGLALPHDHGYHAVDRSCQSTAARGFLLFELYSRAVAFAGRPGM